LRVAAFLTVLGFLTVVLVGPVLALVIGVLVLVAGLFIVALPFALVGLLAWGVYLAATPDRRAACERLGRRVGRFGRWVVAVPLAACVRVCAWGIGVGRALAPRAVPVARRAGEVAREGVQKGVVLAGHGANAAGALAARARPAARFVGGLVLEVIGGAAVGTILVCLADSGARGATLGLHIAAGAVAGALLGLLVGAARSVPKPERG
jgi:hypothetical protein